MDVEVISKPHAVALILEVGDSPGQTLRQLMTVNGNPSRAHSARIEELSEAGILRKDADTFRGRPVSRIYLTELGSTLYNLFCVVRGL